MTDISNHLIGRISGKRGFPTVVVFAGIHGNETAGVFALESIFERIEKDKIPFYGNFIGIKGNISALKTGKRFIDKDLNRIWTRNAVKKLNATDDPSIEIQEQKNLYAIIKEIFRTTSGPYYFIDLHTTSSQTEPFITISDSLNNRKFSSKFQFPVILGIEEFLDGPLLTYMNEFGHISLGFEAGQHEEESSIKNCEEFVWDVLSKTNCLRDQKVNGTYVDTEHTSTTFYHIKEKYSVGLTEYFQMMPGFTNFKKIKKGVLLASSNGNPVFSNRKGQIFMPLYQEQGNDGFFIIRKVSNFWLALSKLLRRAHVHQLLRLLPGIKMMSSYTLRVNPKTARFLATQIFHLLGYRKRTRRGRRWYFSKRDRKISRFI